jgi:hypothetical protein
VRVVGIFFASVEAIELIVDSDWSGIIVLLEEKLLACVPQLQEDDDE